MSKSKRNVEVEEVDWDDSSDVDALSSTATITVTLPAILYVKMAHRAPFGVDLREHADPAGVVARLVSKAGIYAQNRATSEHSGKTEADRKIRIGVATEALIALVEGRAGSKSTDPVLAWIRDAILRTSNGVKAAEAAGFVSPKSGAILTSRMSDEWCRGVFEKAGKDYASIRATATAQVEAAKAAKDAIQL